MSRGRRTPGQEAEAAADSDFAAGGAFGAAVLEAIFLTADFLGAAFFAAFREAFFPAVFAALFLARLAFAQRLRCASAILFLASGLSWRRADFGGATAEARRRPRVLAFEVPLPRIKARACCSFSISASSSAIILSVSMPVTFSSNRFYIERTGSYGF
jgi:hypothetical protein